MANRGPVARDQDEFAPPTDMAALLDPVALEARLRVARAQRAEAIARRAGSGDSNPSAPDPVPSTGPVEATTRRIRPVAAPDLAPAPSPPGAAAPHHRPAAVEAWTRPAPEPAPSRGPAATPAPVPRPVLAAPRRRTAPPPRLRPRLRAPRGLRPLLAGVALGLAGALALIVPWSSDRPADPPPVAAALPPAAPAEPAAPATRSAAPPPAEPAVAARPAPAPEPPAQPATAATQRPPEAAPAAGPPEPPQPRVAETAPLPSPAAEPPAPTPVPARAERILVNVPAGATGADAAIAALGTAGFGDAAAQPTRLVISASTVRYYHPEDAAAAAEVAALIAPHLPGGVAEPRDFSSAPSRAGPGRLEVWIAGQGGSAATPATALPASPRGPSTPGIDAHIQRLVETVVSQPAVQEIGRGATDAAREVEQGADQAARGVGSAVRGVARAFGMEP